MLRRGALAPFFMVVVLTGALVREDTAFALDHPASVSDPIDFGRIRPVTYFNPQTWERRPFYPIGWYDQGLLQCAESRPDCSGSQLPGPSCVQRYCSNGESAANCRYVIPGGVLRDIRCGASPSASPGDDLSRIAAMGGNTILYTDVGVVWSNYEYLARVRYSLDVAQRFGIKVVIQLSPRILQNDASWHPDSCYGTWPSDGNNTCNTADPHGSCTQNRAALTDWVTTLRDHPALLAWELGDEDTSHDVIAQTDPNSVRHDCNSITANEMQQSAAFLHELDPNRQLWQVVSDLSNDQITANYMVGTDVFSHDPYYWLDLAKPATNQSWSAGRTIGMFQRNGDWASRVYGFSPSGYVGNLNIVQGWAGHIEDCSQLNRFPDATEFRWSVFSGLAAGGKRGTLAWHYTDSMNGNSGAYCTPSGGNSYTRPANATCGSCVGLNQSACIDKFNYGCSWISGACVDRADTLASCAQWTSFRDTVVPPVFRDLRVIQRALETGWNVGKVAVTPNSTIANPIDSSLPNYQAVSSLLVYDDAARHYYLVLTNNTTSARSVNASFGLDDLPAPLFAQQANVVGTTQLVTFSITFFPYGLRMSDSLVPLGVKIYDLIASPLTGILEGNVPSTVTKWTASGPAQLASITRTADNSKSLQLWTSGEQYWNLGTTPGSWTQTFAAEPNATNVLRFYAKTGGWTGWYSYTISDEAGVVLASAIDINVGGTWTARNVAFDPGSSRTVKLKITNASVDWVLFDDFTLLPAAANGAIGTTRAWTSTGANVYSWPNVSHTNDGTGSLVLWAGAQGPGTGNWEQCVGVIPNQSYTWRWFAKADGADRYFTYRITTGSTSGPLVYQSGDIWTGAAWAEYSQSFNPGSADVACLKISSLSYDLVNLDDFFLVSDGLQNGASFGRIGWFASGLHAIFLPWWYGTAPTSDWVNWFRNQNNANEWSGSLRLFAGGHDPIRYAGSWGRFTGVWSQCFGVATGQNFVWRFWGRGVVNDMYFHHRIRALDGTPIDDVHATEAAPVRVNATWQQYSVPFNTGSNRIVCVDLGARSWDYVMFDDLSVGP